MSENKSAVTMHWDGSGAPQVTAKGNGETAERIIELAKQHGIPMQQNPQLVELLMQVNLNDEIPADLYFAVAEVIAYVYRLREDLTPVDARG